MADLATKLIPTEPDESEQSESIQQEPHHDKRCEILLNLAEKVFNSDEEVITFFMTRERNLGGTTYVELALKNMAVPPDYLTLSKGNRRIYADVYRLIDNILPIGAGSSSSNAHRKLLENR